MKAKPDEMCYRGRVILIFADGTIGIRYYSGSFGTVEDAKACIDHLLRPNPQQIRVM